MDSALFLRRKSVLALWVVTPLAVILGIMAFSHGIMGNEQLLLMQNTALAAIIPDMEVSERRFEQFAGDYRMNIDRKLSMEDRHIILLNSAAEYVNFTITSINLEQAPPDKTPPGIIQISLFVRGSGPLSDIAAFLNNVKVLDRFLYEKKLEISPDASQPGGALLEAEFGRIYLDAEKKE